MGIRHELITTVTISSDEYKELQRKAERIATVERMVNRVSYVNEKDILAILDFKEKIKGENENA